MSADLSSPGLGGIPVTPSDSASFQQCRGLYVGAGGDITVVFSQGSAPVTLVDVAGGIVHPFCVTQVRATGTTATDIVAIY